ncbi:hypothetical protein COCON_G00082680 [Conger conger]|uniref:Uncharacterized protein n=1 Tax=Conger conger TaxID=82655 RepID=A0A9Q1I231_CONCO|nr:hypothetical protein COCON_G00082680 [Conger conger]
MDDTSSMISDHKDANGFVNRVFDASSEVEKETRIMRIPDPEEGGGSGLRLPRDKAEVSRRPKKTGIWRILNRRKPASGSERRPHSLILPGEASVPKLSFMGKVRSLKKLKSPSVFKGKLTKLSEIGTQEDICPPEEECDLGNDVVNGSISSNHKQDDDGKISVDIEETELQKDTDSHSFEKALKPLCGPPDVSPRDPLFKAALQRCCSLPLPQISPSGADQTSWGHLLPAEASLRSDGVRLRDNRTGTGGRRLMRPASEELHINTFLS